SSLAGNFIAAIYPEISPEERAGIETSILSIPNGVGEDRLEAATNIRNRLLGCIPAGLACVEETTTIIAQMHAEGGAPANVPPFRIGASSGGPYTDEHFLADQGVPVQA